MVDGVFILAPRVISSADRLAYWFRCFGAGTAMLVGEGSAESGTADLTFRTQFLEVGALLEDVDRLADQFAWTTFAIITLHDRLMPIYHELGRLFATRTPSIKFGPHEGMLRARIKPAARRALAAAGLDDTPWVVLRRSAGRVLEVHGEKPSALRGRLVVKPALGFRGESVRVVDSWKSARRAALAVEREMRARVGSHGIDLDGISYCASDVLVERFLPGREYCVDGAVWDGDWGAAVHLKTKTHGRPRHREDDLVVSPAGPADSGYDARFEAEVSRAVVAAASAIGITNWTFHAEVMRTPRRVAVVEINPRPAGGLIWRMTARRLGQEPFETIARLTLGIPVMLPRPGLCLAEGVVYARRRGVVKDVVLHPTLNVESTAVLHSGDRVVDMAQENYAGFVLGVGSSRRTAVRRAREAITRARVTFARPNPNDGK